MTLRWALGRLRMMFITMLLRPDVLVLSSLWLRFCHGGYDFTVMVVCHLHVVVISNLVAILLVQFLVHHGCAVFVMFASSLILLPS